MKFKWEFTKKSNNMIVLYITVGIVFFLITIMNFYTHHVIKSLGNDYNTLGVLSKELKGDLNSALENLNEMVLKGNRKNLDLTESVYSFLKKAQSKAKKLSQISSLKLDGNITKFEKFAQEAYSEKTLTKQKEIFDLCAREVYYAVERLNASDEERSALIHNETTFISFIFVVLLIGNILSFAGIFLVIFFNDRKIREKEYQLNSANANFHAIMQGLDSVLFSFDSNGIIQTWNDNAERYFELKREDALGKNIYEQISAIRPLKAFFDKVLYSQKRHYNYHERLHINKGPSRIADMLCVPLISKGKKDQKALLVKIDDVTTFTTEEEHAIRMRGTNLISSGMEYVMRESTSMQAQAGEVLQALNEISAMHGLMEDTAPYTAYLNNKLAELSVVPQKYASTLQMKNFENIQLDLNDVIMYNLRVCQKIFDPSITVEVSQNESKSWILADPALLSRALFCLLNNAAEALTEMKPEGEAQGGIISVSVEKIAGETIVSDKIMRFRHAVKEPPYWVIMISDTGVGIPDSVLPNIFDMFYTTKNTEIHKGLGLSAAITIINELGGFIDANSKPGNGSVFKIYLPELQTSTEGADSSLTVNLEENDSEIVYGSGTILHVSDDLFLRGITAKLMEKFGYTVISTDNGFEALDIYAQDINSGEPHIQCVVCNLSGGIIRDLDFVNNLKQMNPEAAIAVLVDSEQNEETEQLREIGITDFIKKPYSLVEMSQILAKYSIHS